MATEYPTAPTPSATSRETSLRIIAIQCASTLAFMVIAAIILWIGDGQQLGMIRKYYTPWVAYGTRLWPLVAVMAASLAYAYITTRTMQRLRSRFVRTWHVNIVVLVTSGFILSLLVVWVLRAYPNSGDEYAYIFQAETFMTGRLWSSLPLNHELFSFNHIFEKDNKWVTEFPPGWPLLLAVTRLGFLPFWLTCPLLSGALLLLMARYCFRQSGHSGAIVALALIVPSPFFLFNAASFFSHVPAALFGLLFCYQALIFLETPRIRPAFLAGVALGMLGLIRPFDFVFFALPFIADFFWRAHWKHWKLTPVIILAGMPFLTAYLLYNAEITGHPSLPVVEWGYPQLKLGWNPVDETGAIHNMSETLRAGASRLVAFVEWTSPLLAIAYCPSLVWGAIRRRLSFADFVFPATVAAFLIYPSTGGNSYGPRYYFDAYPLLIATVTASASALMRTRWRLWVRSLVAAHVIMCLISLIVCAIFFRRIVDERMDLEDLARARNLHSAVVIVRSGTGVIRPFEGPLDLVRNSPDLSQDIIFALDFPQRLEDLRQMFSDRTFYVYQRAQGSPRGELIPLR